MSTSDIAAVVGVLVAVIGVTVAVAALLYSRRQAFAAEQALNTRRIDNPVWKIYRTRSAEGQTSYTLVNIARGIRHNVKVRGERTNQLLGTLKAEQQHQVSVDNGTDPAYVWMQWREMNVDVGTTRWYPVHVTWDEPLPPAPGPPPINHYRVSEWRSGQEAEREWWEQR
ncbi:hypothetical protein ACWZHB_00820 [Nocardia sp. FBN12]|uniref:hypothetical protein n=1 Tax=Nocardia sp. FBN12 TaxID=3419766 RepID=UPI003CFEA326